VILGDGYSAGEGEGEGGNSDSSAKCVHEYSSGIWIREVGMALFGGSMN
jgi:hypothetical protein